MASKLLLIFCKPEMEKILPAMLDPKSAKSDTCKILHEPSKDYYDLSTDCFWFKQNLSWAMRGFARTTHE